MFAVKKPVKNVDLYVEYVELCRNLSQFDVKRTENGKLIVIYCIITITTTTMKERQ